MISGVGRPVAAVVTAGYEACMRRVLAVVRGEMRVADRVIGRLAGWLEGAIRGYWVVEYGGRSRL